MFKYSSPSRSHDECLESARKFPAWMDAKDMYMMEESEWGSLYGDICGRRLWDLVQTTKYVLVWSCKHTGDEMVG